METKTGSRYEIQRRIGGGSFGEIFLGQSSTGDKVKNLSNKKGMNENNLF